MAWGNVNIELNCIEADLASLTLQISDVFQSFSAQGLGDVFRDAVLEGVVSEASFEGLSADVAADLKEVFNFEVGGVCLTEMAPGVFMTGGPKIRISGEYQSRAVRAQAFNKIFARAATLGNRTAIAVNARLATLAFLTAKADMLKKQKELLLQSAAPALKVA